MEITTPILALQVADAMQAAFAEHERLDHGQPDPTPIPPRCLNDVAARIAERLMPMIDDAVDDALDEAYRE